MRLNHGPPGAVGLLATRQMVTWDLSFAPCGELSRDITAMGNDKQNDQADRCSICNTFSMCIDSITMTYILLWL